MKKLMLLVLCLGLVGCASLCFAEDEEQPLQRLDKSSPLTLTIASDKQVYAVGDTITISCILKNNSDTIVEFYPYIPRGVRLQSKEAKPCYPEIFQIGIGAEPLLSLKPGETYQYSITGHIEQREGTIGHNVTGAEEIISKKSGRVLYEALGTFVKFKYPGHGSYYLGNYGKYEINSSFNDANKMSQEYSNLKPEEREAFLKDKWNGSVSSNTITIEVAEKMEDKKEISKEKALEIALNHLRKQTWANQYYEDVKIVLDRDNEWYVYFKRKHLFIEPINGLVTVNKETGEAKWIPLE